MKPTILTRAIFFIIFDFFFFFISFFIAYQLRFNFNVPEIYMKSFWLLVFVLIFLKISLLFIYKIYFKTWRYFVLNDARKLLWAMIIADLLFILYLKFFYVGVFPRSAVLIDFVLSFMLVLGFRFSKRAILDSSKPPTKNPTIIIGANQKALNIISSFKSGEINFHPIAIVDDDKSVINSYLANIKVTPLKDLEKIIRSENINSAIITKNYAPKELDSLFEKLTSAGIVNIKQTKLLGDRHEKLQDISIEDLLARKPKDLDLDVIESFIKDKVILITGAGGSIGSEIVRQCDRFGAKKLLLLDHSEYNLYSINEQVLKTPTETLMQSVVDKKLLEKSFKKFKPEIVIHAAAYKHVPLCEENIEGAILNNIIGTKNSIDLSIKYDVKKFVFISTDKAVRPTNVMGATKRVCELYAQNIDSKDTLITAVRFGNVLGSSGSVIPKFKAQIEKNEPLTVTHPDITRYFMLIPEACQLVLQAASIAKNRELFVLDMGEPVKIVDLALKMLKLYGKEDLGIEFTSLRSGEKLYEELLLNEFDKKTIYNSIFVTSATRYDMDKLNDDIENLLQSDDKIGALKKIVPEFIHKES
jgi:UDP-N-acetyl-D-glucosamine 4,6-dehydratase